MKLAATIKEEISPKDKTIIVLFSDDKRKQLFEVKCSFNPYEKGMRKWDTWELKIRFESEIFTDPKTQQKSYFTHLICDDANEKHSVYK